MTRNEKIVDSIRLLLGDAGITWQQLLVNLHNSHPDVKHVYGIKDQGMGITSISVKCNDRTLITCNFTRETIEPPSSWSIPISM
jgi:hypothetical protein